MTLLLFRNAATPAAAQFPTLAIEALFNGTVWTDITPFYDSGGGDQITITRGSSRVESPVIRYDAGTCSIPLANQDRRFDPTNLAGPYVSGGATQVLPMVPIRSSATYQAVTYRLFKGTADSWTVTYDPPFDSSTMLACTDGFKILGVQPRPAKKTFLGGGENTGARVTRILDDAGWPSADRSVTAGDSQLQPTLLGWTPGAVLPPAVGVAGGAQLAKVQNTVGTGTPIDEMQLASESEMGELYINGAGLLVFRHRNGLFLDARSTTSQATFGDTPSTGTAFLAGDASGFEGGIANWVQAGNCGVAQSALQARTGTKSLALTSGAAGNMQAASCSAASIITNGMPCYPGDVVSASAWFRSAVSARSCNIGVEFFDAAGVSLGAALRGADVTDSTSAWTQATATVTAPAATAYARANLQVKGATVGSEVHFADDVALAALAEFPYASVTVAYDDVTLWNGATIANTGGNLQTVADAPSQAQFLPHVYDSESLILDSDFQAANYGQFIVADGKTPELRFSDITIDPQADPANLWPQVLGREIGDRVTIKRRPPGGGAVIVRDVIIRGISHAFTDSTWSTQWILQDATSLPQPFIIGDATFGVIGTSQIGF